MKKNVIGKDIGLHVKGISVRNRARGKIKILFRILIFIFVARREKDKTLCTAAATRNHYNL